MMAGAELSSLERPVIIATVLLALSLFLLAAKLTRPSTVHITVEGEETTVEQIPNLYTTADVVWMVVLSMVAAGSIVYLLTQQPEAKKQALEEHRRKRWEETRNSLAGNEKTVYGVILASEGVAFQSDIVKKTGLGKGTVSIVLGRLEARDLLERKRSGMMNVVLLK